MICVPLNGHKGIFQTCNAVQFRFPIDSLIIVVEILPQDTEDAFYIVDLADVLLKHQKWVSLLPRVEPFYGWYLGKIRVAFAVD